MSHNSSQKSLKTANSKTDTSTNYVKFHLDDLINDFCILLDEGLQKELIESAAKNISAKTKRSYGKYSDLSKHLKGTCKSFCNIKYESIQDRYISQWKRQKMFIPVDCAIELCKLTNISTIKLENHIKKIKHKNCPNKTAVKFPLIYNEDLAFLGETIRVEGNIKKNLFHSNISNIDIEFIKKILTCVKNCGVNKKSLHLYTKIEAEIPKNVNPIKVISENRILKFHVRHPSKSTGLKRKIGFMDKFYFGSKKYYIIFKNRKMKLEITIPKSGKITSKSNYKKSSSVCFITIANMTFCKLLNNLLQIPSGKKSEIIYMPKILYTSPKSVKESAINAVLAAESTIELTGKRIRIGMKSLQYLKDIKLLLKEFDIDANLENPTSLSITGHKNLNRIRSNFDFISLEKNNKLNALIQGYQRKIYIWGEGIRNILLLLNKNEPQTAYEISTSLQKHKDTIFLHLNNGIKKGLILRHDDKQPYRYYISDKGIGTVGEIE